MHGYLRDENGTIKAEHPLMEDRLDDLEKMMWAEHCIGHDIIIDDPWASAIEPPFAASNGNRYAVIGTAPPGITLKELLCSDDNQSIGLRALLVLFYKMIDAVKRIHNAGYLHLDISPSNIRIIDRYDVEGTVKTVASYENPSCAEQYAVMIIDYGCSLKMDEDGMALKYNPSLTTEGYSAPELFYDTYDWIDCRTDIYSLCACIERCIASLPEMVGRSAAVKEQLNEIIRTGMSSEPEYRWSNTASLLAKIGELIRLINGSDFDSRYLEKILETGSLSAECYYRESLGRLNSIEGKIDSIDIKVSQILQNTKPTDRSSFRKVIACTRTAVKTHPVPFIVVFTVLAAITCLAIFLDRAESPSNMASASDIIRAAYTPKPLELLESAWYGDRFYFGSYPQSSDDPEPIEWLVVDVGEDYAIAISDRVLDCVSYALDYEETVWADSYLRSWLNSDFLYSAFSDSERDRLLTVELETPDNPISNAEGGENTYDTVYCLSSDEAALYFVAVNEEHIGAPTAYAIKRGVIPDEHCFLADGSATSWWWLRSPGSDNWIVQCANPYGDFDIGRLVSEDNVGVRPVIHVTIPATYSLEYELYNDSTEEPAIG